MIEKMNARHVALIVLHKTFVEDAYTNLALNEVLQKNDLSPVDRRLTTELVNGTVKNKTLLEYWVKKFVPKYRDLPHWIALNLLLAVYQIRFMDRIPDTAAVNEAVNLAKIYGHKGTVALTNGVLRNMLRTEDAFSVPPRDNLKQFLTINYSHPEWLVERWLRDYSAENVEKLLAFDNQAPPLSIRTNLSKISREELISQLCADGAICTKGKYALAAIFVSGMPSLQDYRLFNEGYFQIQDESSMLAGMVVDPHPGEIVIDACAAPGGKTTHMAEMMKGEGKVLAFDVHEHKIKLIMQNAHRSNTKIISAWHLDAKFLGRKYFNTADRVLVDAPCSGLGVLRRRSDARWRKENTKVKELTVLQGEILESAAAAVKKGGILVYSTCTLLSEENLGVVRDFLKANQEFYPEDITPLLPAVPEGCEETAKNGYLTMYPHVHGTDGFFIFRMRRRNQQ